MAQPNATGASTTPAFVEVAVNSAFPHRQTFSYAVPSGMRLQPGHAVLVPFGRVTLQGIVVEAHDSPTFADRDRIRAVRSRLGDAPLIDADRVALAQWIAHTYLCSVFDALAAMLPPGFQQKATTTVRSLVDPAEVDGLDLLDRQRELLVAVAGSDGVDIDALRAQLSFKNPEVTLAQLERRALIVRDYALARPRLRPKTEELVSLTGTLEDARSAIEVAEPPKHSRRGDLLEHLMARHKTSEETARRLAGSRANLDRLVRAGSVRYDREGHSILLAMSPLEAAEAVRHLRRTRRAETAHIAVQSLAARGETSVTTLREIGVPTPTIRWLADSDVVSLRERAVERDPLDGLEVTPVPPASLLPAQAAAAAEVCAGIDRSRGDVFLIHGVTGSGKTEVYLHAMQHCIDAGKRCIVLVPEIALTPQTIRRFRERFQRVAVLHSGLSDGERFDQWHGIANSRYDIVIGARSAVFAPLSDLGLIVIDEEHDAAYKQHDPAPRYHTRDVAVELARLKGATLVLGSATPDLVSLERARRGEYSLLTLPQRIRPQRDEAGLVRPVATDALPRVSVVDMREELREGNRSIFSVELRRSIEDALRDGDQIILFLNRRGLAGHVQCRDCGFVPDCSSCRIALTFHRQHDRLVCHQCNRQRRLPATCPGCGSPRFRLVGAGVEKVEAEAQRAFPHARLLRWDRDTASNRRGHERIYQSFVAREADILIGTQMLAKGLDIPDVTVVGVVNADVGLHVPDFRASERTFQVLTQVAGRAGRGERPGHVVIQTYSPEHPTIDAAARYDYEGFAETELEARHEQRYPPFAHLVRLSYAHLNPRAAREEARRIAGALSLRRAELGADIEVIGPTEAYVARLRGRWRWQILLRGRDPASLVRDFPLPPEWTIDVDPIGLS